MRRLIKYGLSLVGIGVARYGTDGLILKRRPSGPAGVPVFTGILNGRKVTFACESARERARIEQYERPSKEPETYEWIDRFVRSGDVLFDIGANTGGYSLYAGLRYEGLRVYCFDPNVQNVAQLNKNIRINGLADRVTALCLSLGDDDSATTFILTDEDALFSAGHAGNMANAKRNREGRTNGAASVGTLQVCLDTLVEVYGLNCPNHIKIDVDGAEDAVLGGAQRTLARPEVKSVLFEVDYKNTSIVEGMKSKGFTEFRDYRNPLYFEMEKTEHEPAGVGNRLFIRVGASVPDAR